jgi:predicted permease
MQSNKTRSDLTVGLALVAFLIALDVVARLVPHVPGIWPVAASALFAGRMLRVPLLAFVVPLAATVLSNLVLPGDDGRVMLVIGAALCVPAALGIIARRWRGAAPTVAAMLASSLVFFLTTNFAVWAFDGYYPMTLQGLVECYIAALPFLDRTVLGDLAWCAALFGGAWLVQHGPALARRA